MLLERESGIFTANRLRLYGMAIAVGFAVALAWRFLAGAWILGPTGTPRPVDFVWLWIGGHFAITGHGAAVYDYPTFSAAEAHVVLPSPLGFEYDHWVYPPTLLLLAAPLGLLPYVPAFIAWLAATAALYLAAIWAIIPRPLALLLAMLPLAGMKNIDLGHGGFLIAGLLGLALTGMRSRPFLAGLALGLLSYKPQFGVIFPIVLVAAGEWRVVAGAATGLLLLLAAACIVFGPETWLLYLHAMASTDPLTFMPDSRMDAMNQSFFGLAHWLGAGLFMTRAAYLATALPTIVLVCAIWRRPVSPALKAAALGVGALVTTPYMLAYDLTTLSIPAAFLVREGLEAGFLPGERLVLLGCFLMLFLVLFMPVGPFILAALLIMTMRRAWQAVPDPSPSAAF